MRVMRPEKRCMSGLTLLEVSVSLVILSVILSGMLWLFRWGPYSIQISKERGVAYTLAAKELEQKFASAIWPPSAGNRAPASTDPADPLHIYDVELTITQPFWDNKNGGVSGEPNGVIASGELDPLYSNPQVSVFLTATVYWQDYLGRAQRVSLGMVKAKY